MGRTEVRVREGGGRVKTTWGHPRVFFAPVRIFSLYLQLPPPGRRRLVVCDQNGIPGRGLIAGTEGGEERVVGDRVGHSLFFF